jgi:hypothetical protein
MYFKGETEENSKKKNRPPNGGRLTVINPNANSTQHNLGSSRLAIFARDDGQVRSQTQSLNRDMILFSPSARALFHCSSNDDPAAAKSVSSCCPLKRQKAGPAAHS